MNILTLSTEIVGGGAERIAFLLASGLKNRGVHSHIRIRSGVECDTTGFVSPTPFDPRSMSIMQKIPHFILSKLQNAGIEQCASWSSKHLLDKLPFTPDIILGHTLRTDLIRLEDLYRISKVPMVWTLHDMWAVTGHCAYPLDCTKWQRNCRKCPYPDIYVPVAHDMSILNQWRRKIIFKKIARSKEARLHLVSPSRWLKNQLSKSIARDVPVHVINYGIDTDLYHPLPEEQRLSLRNKLHIPENAFVVLHAAHKGKSNPFKDYDTFAKAMQILEQSAPKDFYIIEVGNEDNGTAVPDGRNFGLLYDQQQMMEIYNCADVFIHTTNADNLPVAILEAMACGVPVIGSRIGGVPEEIEDGRTGFVVDPQTPKAITDAVVWLAEHADEHALFGKAGRQKAEKHFAIERMLDDYLSLCEHILLQ